MFALDADDCLLDGSLHHLRELLEASPQVALAVGNAYFSSAKNSSSTPFQARRITKGCLQEIWYKESTQYLKAGEALWGKEYLLALGGWPAVTGAEDTQLLLTVSSLWDIVYTPKAITKHLAHTDQTTRSSLFQEERDLHREITHQRLNALEIIQGKPMLDHPHSFPRATTRLKPL